MIEDDKKGFLTELVKSLDIPEEDDSDLLEENETFLDDEDQETPQEHVPTFEDFKANNYGRPTKYHEDMPRRLFEFYHKPRMRVVREKATAYGKPIIKTYEMPERFPTVERFLSEQCISRDTFYNWIKAHPLFSDTYSACKEWAKDTLVQNVLEGKWNYKVGVLVAQNYTDIREIPDSDGDGDDEETNGVEKIPPKKKGYDISNIDKYRSQKAIETTAVKVKDGEKKSVQVSQETKNI